MPRAVALTLAALAVAGAAISAYLTHIRHRILLGAEGGALCAIDDWLDCRSVLLSPYAELGGVPLSSFGTWFYVTTGVLALLGLRPALLRLPRSPAAVLMVAYAAATGVSALLAIVSATSVAAFCPLCATLYALNAIGLFVALRGVRLTDEHPSEALHREVSFWAVRPVDAILFGVAALVVLTGTLILTRPQVSIDDGELCELVASIGEGDRLHVTIFSDFQCPHCQELHRALRPVHENEDVQIQLRHFPLESDCNPRLNRSHHNGACLQARAAICAAEEGRLLEMSDKLFEAGPTDAAGLDALAESLGMNASRLAECLRSADATEVLERDIAVANDAGVHATPAVFLNGRRLSRVPKADGIACLAAYRGTKAVAAGR